MSVATYAVGDDWEGLYVDGVLQLEGHSLRIEEVANLLISRTFTKFVQRSVDLGWLETEGSLPADMDNVEWE